MDVGKVAHGMQFGWHQRVDNNWRVGLTTHGGCLERINSLDQVNGEMMVKFGNDFGPNWIPHTNIPHRNWYFFDNPEIPQLLHSHAANPSGKKTFVRFTQGDVFTNSQNSTPDSSRLDAVLTDLSGGTVTLENLIRPVPVRLKNTRRVLLCPVTNNSFKYYYNTTQAHWLWRWCAWCETHGYEPVVRKKTTREHRRDNPQARLYNHLLLEDYAFTISQHSVSAVESIMAGTPAVTTGPSPIGSMNTPPEWAEQDVFVIPEVEKVWEWIQRWASNTYHKQELFSESWRQ